MNNTNGRRRTHHPVPPAAAILLLGLTGAVACLQPTVPGPQVQGVPEGFAFTANAGTEGHLLPDRAPLGRGAWLGDIETFQPRSTIYVTRYAGGVTVEECKRARDAQASRYGTPSSIDYGHVAAVTIDGRAACTWLETRYDEDGAVRSLAYTAVIPYDTVTYAVEFGTSAARRLDPDSVIRVVHSWGQGKTEVLWGVIVTVGVVVAGAAVLLVYWGRR